MLAWLQQQKEDKQLRSEQRAQAFNATLNAMNTVAQATHEAYAGSNSTVTSNPYVNTSSSGSGVTPPASMPVQPKAQTPAPSSVASTAGAVSTESKHAVTPPPFVPSGPKSNCWTVDAPAKSAMGFSRTSEQDARDQAMTNTKGCKIVREMFCDMGRGFDSVKDGQYVNVKPFWDCRVSYHCGETRQMCESKPPAAASKQ
jgi:hypothetical protein